MTSTLPAVATMTALVVSRTTGQPAAVYLARLAPGSRRCLLLPHDLRRSFISDLLAAAADIATEQHPMGHTNDDCEPTEWEQTLAEMALDEEAHACEPVYD